MTPEEERQWERDFNRKADLGCLMFYGKIFLTLFILLAIVVSCVMFVPAPK